MVQEVDTVKQLIEEANTRRSVGSTAANADSSRSHSIMQFALKRYIPAAHHRLVRSQGCRGHAAHNCQRMGGLPQGQCSHTCALERT